MTNKHYTSWSKEDDNTLRDYMNTYDMSKEECVVEAANELGRTTNAIRSRISALRNQHHKVEEQPVSKTQTVRLELDDLNITIQIKRK